LPIDPEVRTAILDIEREFEAMLASVERDGAHLPSRVRSLMWILSSLPVMTRYGLRIADRDEVHAELQARLPQMRRASARRAVANA
jgi:hypothetical protein